MLALDAVSKDYITNHFPVGGNTIVYKNLTRLSELQILNWGVLV